MVRVFIVTILMLCMAVLLTAQNEGISKEEYSRRYNELNRLAEQIKLETGFEGRIEVRPETNRIATFRGNFTDIRVPARDDTLGFERVFDEILDRVLPYFPVDRNDLSKERIRFGGMEIYLAYNQTANGYEIEGPSGIGIYYDLNQELFVINNGLAYLDPSELPAEPKINEEEAIRIAVAAHQESDENRRASVDISNLIYSRDVRDRESEYFLYWYINISGTSYYVNSITGIVDYSFTKIIE